MVYFFFILVYKMSIRFYILFIIYYLKPKNTIFLNIKHLANTFIKFIISNLIF
jgi:hypothetical protein